MAISTTGAFTLDADEVIRDALSMVDSGQQLGYDIREARTCLQLLFQILTLRKVNLWTVEEQDIALTANDLSVTLDADTVDVIECVSYDSSAALRVDLPVERMPRDEYVDLSNKATPAARPYRYFLDRQRDAPVMYLWPVPSGSDIHLKIWRVRTYRTVQNMVQQLDVPNRWLPVIIHGLAWQLSIRRPNVVGLDRVQMLQGMFDALLDLALEEDRDSTPFRISVDVSRYFR